MGAEKATAWLRSRGLAVDVSERQDSMFAAIPLPGGKRAYAFFMRRSTAKFEISLQYLSAARAYAADEARAELLRRLKELLPTMAIATTKATGWPSVPLAALLRDDVWNAMASLMLDIIEQCSRPE